VQHTNLDIKIDNKSYQNTTINEQLLFNIILARDGGLELTSTHSAMMYKQSEEETDFKIDYDPHL